MLSCSKLAGAHQFKAMIILSLMLCTPNLSYLLANLTWSNSAHQCTAVLSGKNALLVQNTESCALTRSYEPAVDAGDHWLNSLELPAPQY
jgi:hypothetical protein